MGTEELRKEKQETRVKKSSGKGLWADTRAGTVVCGWASHAVQQAASFRRSGARKVGIGHGMTPSGRYAGDDFVAYAYRWSPLTGEVVAGKRSVRMCVMY